MNGIECKVDPYKVNSQGSQAKSARGRDTGALIAAMRASALCCAACFPHLAWSDTAQGDVTKTHALNEFGTPKYGPDIAHLDYVNPDAPVGGELSFAWVGTFDSMNPYATLSGTPAVLSSIGYERLMEGTADEVGSSYCLLCETIEYPEDHAWVIFNLRDDVRFSDGTPMRAEDVLFSHELLLEQGTESYRLGFQSLVLSADVLSPRRVKFTFKSDALVSGRISQVASTPVFSKAWFEKTGARLDEARLDPGIGTGEYRLASYDVGRNVTYERNPEYWGRTHPLKVGRGNYDTIAIEYFTNASAAFEAFKAGDVTFRQENSSLQWATGYDFPALDKKWVVQKSLKNGNLTRATGFVFNLRRDKFSDRRVRQALGLMYNFTWTNDNLQFGLFSQRESFWENKRLKAAGLPKGAELEALMRMKDHLPERIFTQEAALPHTSGDAPLDRKNFRKALKLMAEAGYGPDGDGRLRDKDGQILSVEFLTNAPVFDRIIQPYIENLKRLGVDAMYNRVDPAQYTARTQSNEFDMLLGSYSVGLQEGRGLSQRFGCEGKDDIFNPAGFCHPAVDRLADDVANAQTYEEMAALVSAVDRILRDQYLLVPTWFHDKYWVSHYDFYEHPEKLPEFDLGFLDLWWYNQDKADALRAQNAFR